MKWGLMLELQILVALTFKNQGLQFTILTE